MADGVKLKHKYSVGENTQNLWTTVFSPGKSTRMILDQQPDKHLLASPSVLGDGGVSSYRLRGAHVTRAIFSFPRLKSRVDILWCSGQLPIALWLLPH